MRRWNLKAAPRVMLRHPSLRPLSRQHHHALALCVLISRELDGAAPDVEALASRAVQEFEREIRAHFALEEQILFPTITAELGPMPLIDDLLGEHRRLEQLAAELAASPGPAALAAFAALLRSHVRVEENELFEQIQDRLRPETLARLGGELGGGSAPACGMTGNPQCQL